jgi:hypothetical protein
MGWVGFMKRLTCGVRALKMLRGCSRSPSRRIGVNMWQASVCKTLDEQKSRRNNPRCTHDVEVESLPLCIATKELSSSAGKLNKLNSIEFILQLTTELHSTNTNAPRRQHRIQLGHRITRRRLYAISSAYIIPGLRGDRKSKTAYTSITLTKSHYYLRNWMILAHTVPLRVMYFVNTVSLMLVSRGGST